MTATAWIPFEAFVGHRLRIAELASDLHPGLVVCIGQSRQAGRPLLIDDDAFLLGAPFWGHTEVGDGRQAHPAARHCKVAIDQLIADDVVRRRPRISPR